MIFLERSNMPIQEKIYKHFMKVDPIIAGVMSKYELRDLQPNLDSKTYFANLTREIIGQQLSGRVADVIHGRFLELFSKQTPTAKAILKISDQELRDIGMSWAKVKYVKDLALKTQNKEVRWELLPSFSDEEVTTELTKIKGIGRWTAEMFLMFTLGREDVFSFGDLGLKKGLQKLYNLPEKFDSHIAEKIITPWSPYRSYGSLALWESLDNRP